MKKVEDGCSVSSNTFVCNRIVTYLYPFVKSFVKKFFLFKETSVFGDKVDI